MQEFISEPLKPRAGTFDTTRMGKGEPGLPTAFTWRGHEYEIRGIESTWKESTREGSAQGDLYLRRHCYKLLMSDGSIWSVYFTRQTPKSGSPKARWFLYSIDRNQRSGAIDA